MVTQSLLRPFSPNLVVNCATCSKGPRPTAAAMPESESFELYSITGDGEILQRDILLSVLERCNQLIRMCNCVVKSDARLVTNDAICFSHGAQVFDFCATYF